MGITLVALLVLQMVGVLTLWNWGEESFRQLVTEKLISQSPMALVGLLLMHLASRGDTAAGAGRSPIQWTVAACSGVLALSLIASLPITLGGDQMLQQQADQQLAAQRGQLEMARQQSQDPNLIKQLVQQAEATGQVPPGATEEQKTEQAKAFVDRQLQQLEDQVAKAEQASKVNLTQRRFGATGGSILLIVAFTLLCLGSIL
jgi:hypothetical protein